MKVPKVFPLLVVGSGLPFSSAPSALGSPRLGQSPPQRARSGAAPLACGAGGTRLGFMHLLWDCGGSRSPGGVAPQLQELRYRLGQGCGSPCGGTGMVTWDRAVSLGAGACRAAMT